MPHDAAVRSGAHATVDALGADEARAPRARAEIKKRGAGAVDEESIVHPEPHLPLRKRGVDDAAKLTADAAKAAERVYQVVELVALRVAHV